MMKGQYFSFDALVAVVIFVLALSLLTSFWFGVRESMDSQSRDLQAEALRASDTLMTPGYPVDWAGHGSVSYASQIGICTDHMSNRINTTKIDKLYAWVMVDGKYKEVKSALRIEDEYYITLTDKDGNVGKEIGILPSSATNIANAYRTVLYDPDGTGEYGVYSMRVQLWNNRSIS